MDNLQNRSLKGIFINAYIRYLSDMISIEEHCFHSMIQILKGSRLNVQILSKINKTQSKKSINKARIIVRNLCFDVSNNKMKLLQLFCDLRIVYRK